MASTLIFVLVFILDAIAFGLAFAAEHRRASATIHKDANSSYCVYSSDIATGFGVGAFLFLLTSQLILVAATRCLCCGKALRPGNSRAFAIGLFISSWVMFFIAEVCLLAGSVRNAYHTRYRSYISDHPPSCEVLRKGVFGAGASFIISTWILTELYYFSYSKAKERQSHSDRDTGVRMGTYN